MKPVQALAQIRALTLGGLEPRPLRGAWHTLLQIRQVLSELEDIVILSKDEAEHLAAIIPLIGSSAVSIEELDWFEAHGEALAQKMRGL